MSGKTKTHTMAGDRIDQLTTLSSMYDEGRLIDAWYTEDDGRHHRCRISVDELLKLINGVEFDLTFKRKYAHLTVNDEWLESHDWSQV